MGEKKRRLEQGPASGAREALARAFAALQSANVERAQVAFEDLLTSPPSDPELLNGLAVLGLQIGRAADAADLLATAITRAPDRADLRIHRAIALRRLHQADAAIAELEAALALDPSLFEAHVNLGLLLLDCGDLSRARDRYTRALELRPDHPDALNGLGNVELGLGDAAAAIPRFERAIATERRFHEAHYNLSRAWLRRSVEARANGDSGASVYREQALTSVLDALRIDDASDAYWQQFEACVADIDPRPPVPHELSDRLFRALRHPAVDASRLVRPVVAIALSHPGTGDATDRGLPGGRDAVRFVLGSPLLQRLLEETVVANPLVQQIATFARGALLGERVAAPSIEPWLPLDAVIAIAHQHFLTEYVNGVADGERAQVEELRAGIERWRAANQPVPLHDYALYACWRPLSTLAAPERIAADLAATPLRSLATRQIVEPGEEMRLRASIRMLTPVANRVSRTVQAQYEANPYPRWQRMPREPASSSVASFLARRYPHADFSALPTTAERILIAGCGTGRHPVQTAQRFPHARILAVDLSAASLAYASRKTRELGLANVEYAQADLLALGDVGERFDAIESVGVLHHLEDPLAGWRVLRARLKPGGVMRIGLYSARARQHVARARAFAEENGFDGSPEGIRAFRAAVLAHTDDPLLARVARGEDFYSESGCRDLAFHVQEHAFTLPRLAEALGELALAFAGFEFPDLTVPAAYRARFPRDSTMTDLGCWDAFERDNPDAFAAMYAFWACSSEDSTSAPRAAPQDPRTRERHIT